MTFSGLVGRKGRAGIVTLSYHGRWRTAAAAEGKGDVHGEEGQPADDKGNNNDGHGPSSLLLSGAPFFPLHHPLFWLWLGGLGLVLNDIIRNIINGRALSLRGNKTPTSDMIISI